MLSKHKDILRDYQQRIPVSVICEQYGISVAGLKHIRDKYGAEPRRRTLANVEFFDSIDTEEKAYWLGFIAADGNVYKDCLGVRLSKQDEQHLVKLRSSLGSGAKIEQGDNGRGKTAVRLRVSSPQLCKSLHEYGITPAKSHTMQINLEGVPTNLHRHFWRGVVDADGWISITSNSNCKTQKVMLGLAGNPYTMNLFRNFAHSVGVKSPMKSVQRKGRPTQQVAIGGKADLELLLSCLYDDCSVFLDRKYAKVDEAKEIIAKGNRWRSV